MSAKAENREREKERLIEYWTQKDLRGRPPYARIVSERLFDETLPRDFSGSRVLDIGFGDGELAPYFDGRGCSWVGVDISPDVVKAGRENGLTTFCADCRNLPFDDDSFDLTYSLGVVEHFEGTETAIQEHTRVTRSGGLAVVAVPNMLSPYNPLTLAHHVLDGTVRYGIASFGKRYTRRALRRMMEEAGLEVGQKPRLYFQSLILVALPGKFPRLCREVESISWLRWAGAMIWGVGTKR